MLNRWANIVTPRATTLQYLNLLSTGLLCTGISTNKYEVKSKQICKYVSVRSHYVLKPKFYIRFCLQILGRTPRGVLLHLYEAL